MKISVLTPTYNRAYTLTNLYNSLLINKQYADLEWLIMDDGSTDNTEALVNQWIKENKIKIKYLKQANQGKMVALNNLLEHISGEITIECDSDDYFTNDCFKHVIERWSLIESDDQIYGLAFLKLDQNQKLIGSTYPHDHEIARVFDMYFKEKITGDKLFIFKSKIRKQFKHKLEYNETFATEGRMYHEMDLKYNGLLCLNINGMICEYQNDGYSKNIYSIYRQAPFTHYFYYLEMFKFDMHHLNFKMRLHIIKNYIFFSYLIKEKKIDVIKSVNDPFNRFLLAILVIPGYIKAKIKLK